jgi:hypothetical protein
MNKVFAEIGFGNDTLLSTEIESGDTEYRIPKFIKPKSISGYYVRVWILKTMLVLSTDGGFRMRQRNRNKLKILFGISGHN